VTPLFQLQPKQNRFLSNPADIVIGGGAGGGGKTIALESESCRFIHVPNFYAAFFRNTFHQIMLSGGLWDSSMQIYPLLGGRPERQTMRWVFPAGSKVEFSYLQSDKDALKYKGAQFAAIFFDQVEEISEFCFFYMLSRNRSTCGIRPYIRAGCNPDADSWLRKFVDWWIDNDTGFPIPERDGQIRWFIRVGNDLVWGDSREELAAQFPVEAAHTDDVANISMIAPRSVAFVGFTIYDNPALLRDDPNYLANLLTLPEVERERLLAGNWNIRPAAGLVFNRSWFDFVDSAPVGGYDCRFWDFAATEKKTIRDNPDETASVKGRLFDNKLYLMDATAAPLGPAQAEQFFLGTTMSDRQESARTGVPYQVAWEQEPGSASKREAYRFISQLQGVDAKAIPSTSDKMVRAAPLATQARAGNVKVVKGEWNDKLLHQLHTFGAPGTKAHDDLVDASSGCYNQLAQLITASYGMF